MNNMRAFLIAAVAAILTYVILTALRPANVHGEEMHLHPFKPPLNLHSVSDPKHWYPIECCSRYDCYPLMDGDVIEENGGFKIQSTGEWFPYKQIRGSGDAQFHRCSSLGNRSEPTLIKKDKACLFVPGPGT